MENRQTMFPSDWGLWVAADTVKRAERIMARIKDEREQGKTIYPQDNDIFRCLTITPPDTVKAVIIGQDPYHEEGQANGLAFSVNEGIAIPPSLRNIYKEYTADTGKPAPRSGSLDAWAKQGVLLLNTVLTVEDGKANSHKDYGWQSVVINIMDACYMLPQPKVFILWGKQAIVFFEKFMQEKRGHKFNTTIRNKVKVIRSTHPSPLAASRNAGKIKAFLGSRPFSAANSLLRKMGSEEIDWTLG